MRVNAPSQPVQGPTNHEAKKRDPTAQKNCSGIFSSIFSHESAFEFCKGFGRELWNQLTNASSHKTRAAWGAATVVFSALAIPICAQPRKIQPEQSKQGANNVKRSPSK